MNGPFDQIPTCTAGNGYDLFYMPCTPVLDALVWMGRSLTLIGTAFDCGPNLGKVNVYQDGCWYYYL
jgi:hypothetical protein